MLNLNKFHKKTSYHEQGTAYNKQNPIHNNLSNFLQILFFDFALVRLTDRFQISA